jgi:hypothetical protein
MVFAKASNNPTASEPALDSFEVTVAVIYGRDKTIGFVSCHNKKDATVRLLQTQ